MPETRDRDPTVPDLGSLGTRRISDAQTLRALTHPTRVALIESLALHGALTATQAAEHVGESPSSCSFHLRQLARYGFVEEAGPAPGRRRPWKVTSLGLSFSHVHDDPATEVAAAALSELLRTRQLARFETWIRTRGGYPAQWRDAAVNNQHILWLTPPELRALSDRLTAELGTLYRERLLEPSLRPEDALPVEMLTFAYPVAPPQPAR